MVEILKGRPPLFDLIQVAFVVTDACTKLLYANQPAQDLFGYTQSETEGQRVRMLFWEDDLTYLLPNIIYLSLYQDGFKGELLLRQRDGGRIFVHLHTSSFKEEGETFIAFTFQEIQRLKRMERERLEEEHWTRLGRMVEEIAHQIRNPIVSIGGYANRLLDKVPAFQKEQPYLHKILQETGRLERMIHQFEGYIQIRKPSFQREKIQEVAGEVLRAFTEGLSVTGISVKLEVGGIKGEGFFFVDREWLVKALRNLLENSLEAVTAIPKKRKSPLIQVSLFEGEELIGISVSDNGQGMKKKNLHLAFEPFFTTRPDRVGLGLTFVKRVVEAHGGDIQIKTQLRKGTTVTLCFPRDRRRRIRREFLSEAAKTINS